MSSVLSYEDLIANYCKFYYDASCAFLLSAFLVWLFSVQSSNWPSSYLYCRSDAVVCDQLAVWEHWRGDGTAEGEGGGRAHPRRVRQAHQRRPGPRHQARGMRAHFLHNRKWISGPIRKLRMIWIRNRLGPTTIFLKFLDKSQKLTLNVAEILGQKSKLTLNVARNSCTKVKINFRCCWYY